MDHVASGGYEMVGTFNGNPLAMAATRAMLHRGGHATKRTRRSTSCSAQRRGTASRRPSRTLGSDRARGHRRAPRAAWSSPAEPVTNYRGFLGVDDRYSHAHWLYQHNGGVFLPPWGKIEQWLISVQHDEADIDRLIENFGVFARAVSGRAISGKGARRRRRLSQMAHPREGWQGHGAPRKLTRRSFLGRSAGAAARPRRGIPLLDACASALAGTGTVPLPRPNNPVKWPVFTGNQAIASGKAPEEGATLQVYNWVAYVNQQCVDNFAKKYKCKVQVTTFNTMDEAMAKLRSGLQLRRADGRHRRRARPAHRGQAGPAAEPLLHPEHRPRPGPTSPTRSTTRAGSTRCRTRSTRPGSPGVRTWCNENPYTMANPWAMPWQSQVQGPGRHPGRLPGGHQPRPDEERHLRPQHHRLPPDQPRAPVPCKTCPAWSTSASTTTTTPRSPPATPGSTTPGPATWPPRPPTCPRA